MEHLRFSSQFEGRVSRLACVMAAVIILVAVLNALDSYMRLRHIPGPRLAALTNFLRRWWVATGEANKIHTDLHRKYGPVVRFGPNAVMISQPKAIDKIYGFKTRFQKACHTCTLNAM